MPVGIRQPAGNQGRAMPPEARVACEPEYSFRLDKHPIPTIVVDPDR
jgi:hypothetical protein